MDHRSTTSLRIVAADRLPRPLNLNVRRIKILRLLLSVVLSTMPFAVFAGRPVFFDRSLSQVVEKSDAVVVAERPYDFKPTTAREKGCEVIVWPLMVREVLYSAKNWSLTALENSTSSPSPISLIPGQAIDVAINPTWISDCRFRSENTNGVSFVADYYRSSLGTVTEPPNTLILFLTTMNGRLIVTFQNAFESVDQIESVRKEISSIGRAK